MAKSIKENFNKILSIFILIQPVIDLVTGILIHNKINLTIGIIIRALFLLFIVYTCLFTYKRKKLLIPYLIIFIYSLLYVIGIIVFKDNASLFKEIQGLFRTMYFPLLLISLYSIKDELNISKSVLFSSLVLYLVFIIVPTSLNIGFKSYAITKSGTLGFYNSANEISGIISILTPIIFIMFKESKNVFLKIIFTIIYLIVILTIGTKTPLLSLFVTVFWLYIWLLFKFFKEKKYKLIGLSLLVIIVGLLSLVMVIPKTNFYKNIKTHINYLKIKDVEDIIENPIIFDHFIFSERLTFLGNKKDIYDNSSIYQKLFGIGYLENYKETKLIEIDYYDIYYSHGLIGFIVFFSIYIYVLIDLIKGKHIIDFDRCMISISLFLVIILSMFSGHIITAPAVSIFVAILIIYLKEKNKKELLFTAVNLEIGGIETSLINLANRIDKNKYNVTIILEEKKGVLLNRLNKNIKVLELKVSNNKNAIIRKTINTLRRLMFTVFNYHNYDFSCCYATYGLSGNKLSKIASSNNSIYVHSDYKYVYKNINDFHVFFDQRKIKDFKYIIFVSKESQNSFLTEYPTLKNKTLVLNNFIDINSIIEKSHQKIIERNNKNKKLFVFIGRLDDSSKKLTRALNIVKELKNIELLVVGDGPDRKKYEKYVKENDLSSRVKFIGQKPNPYPYMNIADYIILTSDYEGFPVVYLEAIVLKKKIITTVPTSDDLIDIRNYATIISKDEKKMVKEVKEALEKTTKTKEIDLEQVQNERMKSFEALFDGVI